jgi:hypothetical protein
MDDAQNPTAQPGTCPRCGSHSPSLHPAVQAEGEVCLCPHPWHDDPLTAAARSATAAPEPTAPAAPLLGEKALRVITDALNFAHVVCDEEDWAIEADAVAHRLEPLVAALVAERERLARTDHRAAQAVTRTPPTGSAGEGESVGGTTSGAPL